MANTKNEAKVKFIADTAEFRESLKQANSTIKEQQSALKLNTAQMKLEGESTDLLQQRVELLNDELKTNQKQQDAVNGQLEAAVRYYGENSQQAAQLRTKLNTLKTQEAAIEKEIKNTNEGFNEQADVVDDATDAVEDNGEGFTVLKGIMADLAANAIQSIISGFKDLASSALELAEETREYRANLAKLDTAFESAGYSAETAKDVYKELYAVLGDEDRSVEAAGHLAKLVDTEEDLQNWTNICAGVWGTFGDSLPIEGLTEAANETARTGELTGVLTDAINWASQAGETFGVTMKEDTEANEDWNKSVEEAASAEDYFKLALQECTTQKEREALITETLSGLYDEAADTYRETNKTVIEANELNMEYSDTLADIGEMMEPLSATIKNGYTEMLKGANNPKLKKALENLQRRLETLFDDLADISGAALPKVVDALVWAIDNVKKLAVAIPALVTAWKAVSSAMKIAESQSISLMAAMATNPITAATAAIGLLTGAIALIATTAETASTKYEETVNEYKRMAESAEEARQAAEDLRTEHLNAAEAEVAQIEAAASLYEELQTLADASGTVKDADKARADFILDELNEALGTELTMTGNQIDNYAELRDSIYQTIEAKKAEIWLSAAEEDYAEAVKNVAAAEEDAADKLATRNELQVAAHEALNELTAAQEKLNDATSDDGTLRYTAQQKTELAMKLDDAQAYYDSVITSLDAADAAYQSSEQTLQGYYTSINRYKDASVANQEGNYKKVAQIISGEKSLYFQSTEFKKQSLQSQLSEYESYLVELENKMAMQEEVVRNGGGEAAQAALEETQKEHAQVLSEYQQLAVDLKKVSAKDAGVNLINTYVEGINQQKAAARYAAWSVAQAAKSAMSTSQTIKTNPYYLSGSHAAGLDYVPYDGYIAELHKGEMVVPQTDAELIREHKKQIEAYSNQSKSYTQNISRVIGAGTVNTAAVAVSTGRVESLLSAILNKDTGLYINGQKIATATARDADSVNGTRVALTKRGLAL